MDYLKKGDFEMYYTIDTIKKGLQDNAYLPTTGIAYAVSSAINQSIPIIILIPRKTQLRS